MKKYTFSSLLALVFTLVSLSTFAHNEPTTESSYVRMTLKELKATYADVRIDASLQLSDDDIVVVNARPCDGELPCDAQLAQARHEAQMWANECCCVAFFGVICCDYATGNYLAIDGIVMPPANCN
jgi:hypothetical protein